MRALLLTAALLLTPAPALAQDAAVEPAAEAPVKTARQLRREAERARETAELRVEADMITMTSLVEAMSKNLGQMHYLRTLCFGANDQYWREYMTEMLSIETGDDPERRRELTRAFNAGYYAEAERHTRCEQSVSVDVAALAENGRHISAMLGDPYRER